MVDSLLSEKATSAVDLLRSDFLGFFGDISIYNAEQQKHADFLTAEGVLLKPEIDAATYHMASPFVDSLIRQHVIPKKYPNAPSTPIPKRPEGRPMDTLKVLKESLKCFDKNLIREASDRSYKKLDVKVGGLRNIRVPRESVYDTELMRILLNWLKLEDYSVGGQCHLLSKQGHRYDDIVIKKDGEPTVFSSLWPPEPPGRWRITLTGRLTTRNFSTQKRPGSFTSPVKIKILVRLLACRAMIG